MTAALILAAGRSERMGFPKALVLLEGRSFLDRILDCIDDCPFSDRLLVVGRHAREISERAGRVATLLNPRYEKGMTTSFQAGIRALGRDVDGVVVFLVDHPLVSAATVRALLAERDRGEVVVPVYGGRRGHPVFFSRPFMDEILELPPDKGVDTLVRRRRERVVEVPVPDPGILADIDTPEDLGRLGKLPPPGEG